MAPSRFVGYAKNTFVRHPTLEGIDGGVTDAAITRVLGERASDGASEAAYRRICVSFDIAPSRHERRYWVLSLPRSVRDDHIPERPARPIDHTLLAKQLKLPLVHEARMRAIVATSVNVIRRLRPEWYRARLDRKTHLRIFCGRLIVVTLEGKYVWLALDENVLGKDAPKLRSWCWDEPRMRPKDAMGQAYPRYVRPPSRNGFYDPEKDPEGLEWRVLEVAHHHFLRHAAKYGRAPDSRTQSDPSVLDEIANWKSLEFTDIAFDLAVREALNLPPEARRARLARALRKPELRTAVVVVFTRNADVVAEVLHRASGRCEHCARPAPFARASDGSPYLEVHHRVRLADGGDDTIENAVALCPNCHREQHFG